MIDPPDLGQLHFTQVKIVSSIGGLCYLLGSIPFGYIVGKFHGIDIRQHGSGNIGATNVTRVLGKRPGRIVFAGDMLKGLAAVLLGKWIAGRSFYLVAAVGHDTLYRAALPISIGAIAGAIACILGHNFPIWLRFKGGKGMATSCGVLIGMMPLVCVGCLLAWGAVFRATRYVSLASIAASLALPLGTVLLLFLGLLSGWPYFYFAVVACILAIWRHRSNIGRLLKGTEPRFERKVKPEESAA